MFKAIANSFGVVGLLIVIIGIAVVMPFLTLWSVNTIFPVLAIPYTLETWAATILLGIFVRGSSK
jgi:hypothetical protein